MALGIKWPKEVLTLLLLSDLVDKAYQDYSALFAEINEKYEVKITNLAIICS